MNEYPLDLSLCMIAKNEEEFLSRHLPVIMPLISEFIYVDTGSSDRSKAIAEQYGAKIFFKEWKSDFADVRNFAIRQASQKWILVLDADEVVSAEDFPLIKTFLENNADAGGFIFRQRSYLNDPDSENWMPNLTDYEEGRAYKGYIDVCVVRIFENKSYVCYTGAAHDLVEYSIAERPKVETNIPIHHYGMIRGKAKGREKDEDYFRQLEKDVENHPGLFKTRFTFGRLLFRLKRFKEAEEQFLRSLQIRPDSAPSLLNLGMTYIELKEFKSAKHCLEQYLKIEPAGAEGWNTLGVVSAGENDFSTAREYFRKAHEINAYSPKFANNYSTALMRLLDYDQASAVIDHILKRFNDYVPALVNQLKICVHQKKYSQAVDLSRKILFLNKDYAVTVQEIIRDIPT